MQYKTFNELIQLFRSVVVNTKETFNNRCHDYMQQKANDIDKDSCFSYSIQPSTYYDRHDEASFPLSSFFSRRIPIVSMLSFEFECTLNKHRTAVKGWQYELEIVNKNKGRIFPSARHTVKIVFNDPSDVLCNVYFDDNPFMTFNDTDGHSAFTDEKQNSRSLIIQLLRAIKNYFQPERFLFNTLQNEKLVEILEKM